MKKIFILVLMFVFGISLIIACRANPEKEKSYLKDDRYVVVLTLETKTLKPPAVVYAVFEQDPMLLFKKDLTKSKDWYETAIKKSEKGKEKFIINSTISCAWDRGFKLVSGRDVNLLCGTPWSVMLNNPAEKGKEKTIYLATKATYANIGEPIFWYFPIKIKAGEEREIVLTDKNSFNYHSLPEANYIDFSLVK